MKKLLHILFFFPLFGFAQGQVDCSLLSVTDVIIQNDSITFEIYNADTMDTHYPYVSYTLDANGDTIQIGQMNWYVTPGETTSYYYSTHNMEFGPLVLPSFEYPLSIYFTYTNFNGEDPGDYTCELFYNPQMEIVSPELILPKTLMKTIDILGREVNKIPNNIIIEIYDDGSSKKRIIIL